MHDVSTVHISNGRNGLIKKFYNLSKIWFMFTYIIKQIPISSILHKKIEMTTSFEMVNQSDNVIMLKRSMELNLLLYILNLCVILFKETFHG